MLLVYFIYFSIEHMKVFIYYRRAQTKTYLESKWARKALNISMKVLCHYILLFFVIIFRYFVYKISCSSVEKEFSSFLTSSIKHTGYNTQLMLRPLSLPSTHGNDACALNCRMSKLLILKSFQIPLLFECHNYGMFLQPI